MDTDQSPEPGESPALGRPSEWRAAPPPKRTRWTDQLGTVGIGAVVNFVVMAVLYGVSNAIMAVGLLVVCTIGIGLIPIILVSWLVGWVVRAAWRAIRHAIDRGGPTVAPGAPGG